MVDPAHAFDVIYALEDFYFPLSKCSDFLNVYSLTKSFGIESLYLTINRTRKRTLESPEPNATQLGSAHKPSSRNLMRVMGLFLATA